MGNTTSASAIIHRGPTNDKPGDPISVIYHDFTPEVYMITSGTRHLDDRRRDRDKRAGTACPM